MARGGGGLDRGGDARLPSGMPPGGDLDEIRQLRPRACELRCGLTVDLDPLLFNEHVDGGRASQELWSEVTLNWF